jgi:hypothetical protein
MLTVISLGARSRAHPLVYPIKAACGTLVNISWEFTFYPYRASLNDVAASLHEWTVVLQL